MAIAAGRNHTCAVRLDGTVWCWGDNVFGQLGTGSASLGANPSPVQANISGAVTLSAGEFHTCALLAGGTVKCWGRGSSGELGAGSNNQGPQPVAVAGLSGVSDVSAGGFFTCALLADSTVRCWGSNLQGQLGAPSALFAFTPIAAAINGVAALTAGRKHTCAILGNGTAECWGNNSLGELGDGTTIPRSVPGGVMAVADAVEISAGDSYTCATTIGGKIRCWGDNTHAQLGDGGPELSSVAPVTVAGVTHAVAISAGADHACALSAFGNVSCWGANGSGQIGDGTVNPAPFPHTVSALTTAAGLSAGAQFTCAVRANSTASCWGDNTVGELAAADSSAHLTPAPVINSFVTTSSGGKVPIPLQEVVSITTSDSAFAFLRRHACALRVSGEIRCWGANGSGQMGDGTMGTFTTTRPRPTVVNSFTANVDPDVALDSHSRVARVTALINCEIGEAHIHLTLEQGETTGSGNAVAACTDQLARVPVIVPALGPAGFHPGAAIAHVEAVVRERGGVTQDQHSTREVILSTPK